MAEYDVDKVLVIDNELRTIDIPEDLLLGVESDEAVQKLIFDMPRYYNGIDLSVFAIRVNYMNANNEGDVYVVDSPTIDTERITFTWVVGRQATKYKGDTHFVVCLKKLRQDSTIEKEFNTTVHALPVLVGLETTEAIIEEHPDIFEQLLVNLVSQTNQAVQTIETVGQGYVDSAAASAATATQKAGDASDSATAAEASAQAAAASAASVDADEWNKKIQKAFVSGVSSGEIASFDDGADDIPMRSVKAQIEPVQDLHGYDSPWPAGGGKNKLPMTVAGIKSANSARTWSDNSTTFNGITYTILTNESGAVTGIQANGTATANAPLFLWVPTVEVFKSKFSETSVRFNGGVAGGSATTYYMRIAQLSPYVNIATVTGANDAVVSLSSISDSAGGIQVLVNVDNGTTVNNIVFKPMLRLSTEADATFAPYSNECPISGWTGAEVTRTGINLGAGQTFPVTWESSAGTVYGGTIDVVSGELKVDRASIDMGTLNWTKSGGANSRFSVNVSNCKTNGVVIADLFQPATYSQVYYHNLDNAIASHNTYSQIAIHSTEYEADYDAEGFKTAMSGHYAVYELAQPVIYRLSAQQITSLLGQNNVWSNTGDVELEYSADTGLVITGKVPDAPTTDGTYTLRAIVSGGKPVYSWVAQ